MNADADRQAAGAESEAEEAARLLARARAACAQDPRPKLGMRLCAGGERERQQRLAARLAEPGHAQDLREAWARNERIAGLAAAAMEAWAATLPDPAAADPARVHQPHDWASWRAVEDGLEKPSEYQAHVIEAMREARAAGLHYNSDTGPRCAAILAARWGYPDAREGAPADAEWGTWRAFGSHCYSAGKALRAQEHRARVAAASRQLAVGQSFGRVIVQRQHVTAAVVESIEDDGARVRLSGRRAGQPVEVRCDAACLLAGVRAAMEWKQQRRGA
jgi:hypothetical protein